jgi:hypothetical protein
VAVERRQHAVDAPVGAQRLRRLAWLLDDVIRIPGTNLRFGIDPLLGLLPVGGDLASGALSTYIIVAASKLGAPPAVLVRMAGNVVLDTVLGAVPLLGDLFDASWKSNRRNLDLLQQFVDRPEPVQRRSRLVLGLLIAALILLLAGAAFLSYHVIRWIIGQF